MTAGVAIANQAARAPQVGSFTIVERLSVPDAPKGQVVLRVTGADGTPFVGQEGIATCCAAPKDETALEGLKALVDKLSALRHPSLAPILQAGVSGNVVFWVRPAKAGDPLTLPTPDAPVPFATVVAIVNAAASGLSAAHEAGLSHGSLTLDSIVSPAPGSYVVTGVGATGVGAAQDQRDLGAIVVALLSGRSWQEDTTIGPVSIEQRVARAQRLRDVMNGCTERVVNVVLRAIELNPADRFAGITEFAEQFGFAVRESTEDLVHGAFEAISSRNVELARLLAAKAAHYNPSSDSLALLNLQLGGGSAFGAFSPGPPPQPGFPAHPQPGFPVPTSQPGFPAPAAQATPSVIAPAPPALTLPPMGAPGERQSVLSPELTQGLPREFLETIAPQFEVTKPKQGMHPMFIMLIGGLGVIVLLLIAGLATMMLTSS